MPTGTLSSDRIVVVDVLRAFALFGIVIAHSAMAFLAGPAPDPQFNTFSSLDGFVGELVRLFSFGKFFGIFSFLFGLSFAIQIQNAIQKGVSFSGRFAWRLMVLLAIGLAHNAFFSGDILIIYALLGFLLIPCRNLNNKSLVVIALIFILNIPGLFLGLLQVSGPPPSPEQQQVSAARGSEQFIQRAQRQFDIKQSGTLKDVVKMNITESLVMKLRFQIITGRLWITFGLFLLGVWAGRTALFKETEVNRTFFKRLLLWAGTTATIATIIAVIRPSSFQLRSISDVLASFSFSIQQASLASVYVAAVTLMLWKKPAEGLLPRLAPIGKMGLTTYLMQSVFGLILFYGFGFGLLGQLGLASCVGLGILFFVAQIYFSRWWLSHFNMGPVEWLWRSLTYFKIQPNVRVMKASAT